MSQQLNCAGVTHAHIKPIVHPRLGVGVDGRSVVRYLRFRGRVRVDYLDLPRVKAGRWEPDVPTHPAHVVVSVLDGKLWRSVKDVEFPPDSRIGGAVSDRKTSPEEMANLLKAIYAEPPLRIELEGLETDHLRVECDREHPVWPNHGDCSTGAAGYAVPFGLLDGLTAHGEMIEPLCVTAGAASAQFEIFCNGSIVPAFMGYYIRALAIHGLKARARQLARDMEEGFLEDVISSGTAEGAEFFAWDGTACGYEGTFGPNCGPMYALAIERGLFKPPQPEWWPAGG